MQQSEAASQAAAASAAAASQAAVAASQAAAHPAAPQKTPQQQLEELQTLYKSGLITESDYNAGKAKILAYFPSEPGTVGETIFCSTRGRGAPAD